ncbi:hypothetical protein D3C81_1342780 [compost metagenome]
MHNALGDDNILPRLHDAILDKRAFNGFPGFYAAFILAEDPSADFDGPFRLQLRRFYPAAYADVPCSPDLKAGLHIPADDNGADKVNIANIEVHIPVYFIDGEYIDFITVRFHHNTVDSRVDAALLGIGNHVFPQLEAHFLAGSGKQGLACNSFAVFALFGRNAAGDDLAFLNIVNGCYFFIINSPILTFHGSFCFRIQIEDPFHIAVLAVYRLFS